MTQYLLGDLKLRWNGSNPSVGGGALIPREGSLKEAVINFESMCSEKSEPIVRRKKKTFKSRGQGDTLLKLSLEVGSDNEEGSKFCSGLGTGGMLPGCAYRAQHLRAHHRAAITKN
jgi:hypothetical protein